MIIKMMSMFGVVAILCTGCIFGDNDKHDTPNSFVYPLEVGNSWEYKAEMRIYNIRPGPPQTVFDDTLDVYMIAQTIVGTETFQEAIQDSIMTYVVKEHRTFEDNQVYEANTQYYADDTGLYLMATERGSMVTLKNNARPQFFFKGRYFNSMNDITRWLVDAPLVKKEAAEELDYEWPYPLCLANPLKVGKQWTYRNSWRVDKKVMGIEKVTVPAGTLNCYKIEWLMDIDGDGEWDTDISITDYICSKGLVKRVVLAHDVGLYTPDSPDIASIGDSREEYILLAYDVK